MVGLQSCERKHICADRRAKIAVWLDVGTTAAVVGTNVLDHAHLKRQTSGGRGNECWHQRDPEPKEKRDHAVRRPNHHGVV